MIRKLIYIIAVLIVLIVLGLGWHYWQQPRSQLSSLPQPIQVVKIAVVSSETIPSNITAVGTLQAKQAANISSNIAGKITAVLYIPGSYVTKGTPLITLDDRTYRAALQSDQAAMKLAQLNYERYQSLVKMGALSQQTLDQARADFLQAQAKMNQDETLLSDTIITAPFDGYVGAKNVSVGDYVSVGQTLTIVVNRQLLQTNYSFPEKYLPELKLGQKVVLTLVSTPKSERKEYLGTVTYIAPEIDDATHSVAIQADVPNPKNELSPGLFVKVKQQTGVDPHVLVIPEAALVPTITGNMVYTVVNGKARAVNVEIGVIFNNKVEIVKGLQEGDIVIVAGQEQVKNGTQVKFQEKKR